MLAADIEMHAYLFISGFQGSLNVGQDMPSQIYFLICFRNIHNKQKNVS